MRFLYLEYFIFKLFFSPKLHTKMLRHLSKSVELQELQTSLPNLSRQVYRRHHPPPDPLHPRREPLSKNPNQSPKIHLLRQKPQPKPLQHLPRKTQVRRNKNTRQSWLKKGDWQERKQRRRLRKNGCEKKRKSESPFSKLLIVIPMSSLQASGSRTPTETRGG
jgi:hypothetical protein